MINNVTNVDTHTNMSITKAATTLASNPIPPLIGFRGKRADEKATLRVKKIKRNDNIIIVGNIDEDYVDYVDEGFIEEAPPQTGSFSFLKLPPQKKYTKYLKNCYVIDFIHSPRPKNGLGTEAIKILAEKAFFDTKANGRIVTFSTPVVKDCSPAIFFYKLGFRFTQESCNEHIEECIRKNEPDIPAQTGMMYLPKNNLQKLLRYGDLF